MDKSENYDQVWADYNILFGGLPDLEPSIIAAPEVSFNGNYFQLDNLIDYGTFSSTSCSSFGVTNSTADYGVYREMPLNHQLPSNNSSIESTADSFMRTHKIITAGPDQEMSNVKHLQVNCPALISAPPSAHLELNTPNHDQDFISDEEFNNFDFEEFSDLKEALNNDDSLMRGCPGQATANDPSSSLVPFTAGKSQDNNQLPRLMIDYGSFSSSSCISFGVTNSTTDYGACPEMPLNHQFPFNNSCTVSTADSFMKSHKISTPGPDQEMSIVNHLHVNCPAAPSHMVAHRELKTPNHDQDFLSDEEFNKFDSEMFSNLWEALNNDDSLMCGCPGKTTANDPSSPSLVRFTAALSQETQYNNHGQLPRLMESDSHEKHPTTKKWTEEEHRMFLKGVDEYGKGRWKMISKKCVPTKSNIQIASHAQKYYQR